MQKWNYCVSPKLKQGLYYFPLQNMTVGIIVMGFLILIYQKMKLQSKNYGIFNEQKLRKKIYISLR